MPTATPTQIKEIEDYIVKGKVAANDLDKGPEHGDTKKHFQKAIELADKYFKITLHSNCAKEPTYKPYLPTEAKTYPKLIDGKPKGVVNIGEKGFFFDDQPSAIWLAAAKVHEIMGHCTNGFKTMLSEKLPDDTRIPMADMKLPEAEDEVIAYGVMLKWKAMLGLTPKMIKVIKGAQQKYFDKLPEEKKKEYKKQYPYLALNVKRQDYRSTLAAMAVPAGVRVRSRDGLVFTTETTSSLLALAETFSQGDIEEFSLLNPTLETGLEDGRRVPLYELNPISLERERTAALLNVPRLQGELDRKRVEGLVKKVESKGPVLIRQ